MHVCVGCVEKRYKNRSIDVHACIGMKSNVRRDVARLSRIRFGIICHVCNEESEGKVVQFLGQRGVECTYCDYFQSNRATLTFGSTVVRLVRKSRLKNTAGSLIRHCDAYNDTCTVQCCCMRFGSDHSEESFFSRSSGERMQTALTGVCFPHEQ